MAAPALSPVELLMNSRKTERGPKQFRLVLWAHRTLCAQKLRLRVPAFAGLVSSAIAVVTNVYPIVDVIGHLKYAAHRRSVHQQSGRRSDCSTQRFRRLR